MELKSQLINLNIILKQYRINQASKQLLRNTLTFYPSLNNKHLSLNESIVA